MIRHSIVAARTTSFVAKNRSYCMGSVLFASSKSAKEYENAFQKRSKRTVSLHSTKWTLESTKLKFDRGTLNLLPKYQRGFKWKTPEASRLILTVLEERFVPPIVVHQLHDSTYDVVDGKQRLSAFLSFFYGEEAARKRLPAIAAKLQKLEDDDEDFNGLTYELLSDAHKRQYDDFALDVKIIPKQTDDATVFAVYEDINSGGMKLAKHQIRRAAYYGPYIELIDDLSEHDVNFRAILGSGTTYDESLDGEMVLRAFAVCQSSGSFKLPLKNFLNKEIRTVRDMSDSHRNKYLNCIKEEFKNTMLTARNVFGDKAFRKYDNSKEEWSKKVDIAVLWPSLYQALVLGNREKLWNETKLLKNRMVLQNKLKECYEYPDFESLFKSNKTSMKTLQQRHEILKNIIGRVANGHGVNLNEIMISDQGNRSFDRKMIPELYESQNGRCNICKTDIDEDRLGDGSYVHIDHKEAYANGGHTIPENAQLVHAKCNQSKGAK